MNKRIKKVFKKDRFVIGSVHFPPLLGYKGFPGLNAVYKIAKKDIKAFEDGGVDATIIENNYDIPHTEKVGPEILASMTVLANELRQDSRKSMGVDLLWNDFEGAFSIARTADLQFIRVPVFVDTVHTECGKIKGDPKYLRSFRKTIEAEDILLFADIHVKHSKLLSNYSLLESAKRAFKFGADGIIITGSWTGKPPEVELLHKVRKSLGASKTILVGSGADSTNINEMFKYVNGVIVSTSLKSGNSSKGEENVKKFNQRISKVKVKAFVKSAR